MSIFGLMTTEQFAATRSENARRCIFYAYPQGKFPLAGLLSLTEDGEALRDVISGHWEQRYKTARSRTAQVASGKGPFASAAGTSIDVAFTPTVGTTIIIYVEDASVFRVRDTVQLMNAKQTGGVKARWQLVLTAVQATAGDPTNNYLTGYWIDTGLATTTIDVTSANNAIDIVMTGTATAEGDRSLDGGVTLPTLVQNYTQIYRTAFRMTGTALQLGQRYDQSGAYKKTAKENALRHMEAQEQSLLWGTRRAEITTNKDGESVPRHFMGGLLWHLKQWELRNTANTGATDYAIGEASITSTAWTADDRKRIIGIYGTISKTQWDDLVRRMFYRTSNVGFEKLLLMGGGFMQVLQNFFEDNSIRIHEMEVKGTYGMTMYKYSTIHGTLVMKGHPLFIENPALAYSAFVVDVGNLVHHDLANRGSQLLKHRQANDADYRKDEWLGESTAEIRFPESHMFIDQLTGILS